MSVAWTVDKRVDLKVDQMAAKVVLMVENYERIILHESVYSKF